MKTNKIIKTIGMSTVGVFGVGMLVIPTIVLSSCSNTDEPKEETKITISTEDGVTEIKQNLEKNVSLAITTVVAPVGTASLKAAFEGDGITVPSEGTIKFKDNTDGTGILTIESGGDLTNSQTVIITASCDGIEATIKVIVYPLSNKEKLKYTEIEGGYTISAVSDTIISGSLIIPDAYNQQPVIAIANNGFVRQTQMTSIIIPNSVTTIGQQAFSECTKLASVNIDGDLTNISSGTFQECVSLSEIIIPDSVTSIADMAFIGCSSLTKVEIGSKLGTDPNNPPFGMSCFFDCPISSVIINPDNPKIMLAEDVGDCLIIIDKTTGTKLNNDCSNVIPGMAFGDLALPSNVTSISDESFAMAGLSSVTLPKGIDYIGQHAFSGCPFTSITIDPDNTTYKKELM